jgi:hypothetical protein
MPKTNEKDAYYFPHDCNARNDPKILALRSVFGAEGYGVYFMLVEMLREQPDYKLRLTKYLYDTLAMQMQVQKERLQEIVDSCCTDFAEGDSTLLVNDGEYLYSASLLRRMGRVDDISRLRREAAKKRWENKPCKDYQEFPESKQDANAQQMQSKEKQSRAEKSRAEQTRAEKKSTGTSRSQFTPPSLDDVAAYCRERGNTVDPQRWFDYYTSNGWMVGKNHMKDWKAAVRTWERGTVSPARGQASGNIFLEIAREEGIVGDKG